MRNLLASLRLRFVSPSGLDEDTAERLLAARLELPDTPPGYLPVIRMLAAVTATAHPDELAGRHQAVAEFAALVRSRPPTPTPRRAAMPNRILPVKAAAVAVVAMLSVGGVAAAATGLLPGSAEQATKQASASPAGGRSAKGDAAIMINDRDAQAASGGLARARQGSAVGPDASGPAKTGLCQAWLAGQGGNQGKRADSPAFQALTAAAGGAEHVAAYCHADPGASATHGRRPTTPPNSPRAKSTPSTGPPASLGHGQGGPPTTEGD
jgi:hypothetical protein